MHLTDSLDGVFRAHAQQAQRRAESSQETLTFPVRQAEGSRTLIGLDMFLGEGSSARPKEFPKTDPDLRATQH
jgi:hypothetical protein